MNFSNLKVRLLKIISRFIFKMFPQFNEGERFFLFGLNKFVDYRASLALPVTTKLSDI